MATYCGKCQQADGIETHPRYGYLCAACADDVQREPAVQLVQQTVDADATLTRDAKSILAWPFVALDRLAGPLPPGAVAYVAGFSGLGKTTFITACIKRWRDEGRRVYVMPLETEAKEWRVRYACAEIGLPAGDALSGELRRRELAGDEDAERTRTLIADAIRQTAIRKDGADLYVSPDPFVDLTTFSKNVRLASEWGYDVVVVDHIDHVRPQEGKAATAASSDIQYHALDLAKRYDLPLVLMSQVNLNAVRGSHDHLAAYRAPREDHLANSPSAKRQIATQVLGLFRPLRADATVDEKKAASAGDADPSTVLEKARLGIAALKLRHYGERNGQRCELAYDHGVIRDLSLEEYRGVQAADHRIATHRDLA